MSPRFGLTCGELQSGPFAEKRGPPPGRGGLSSLSRQCCVASSLSQRLSKAAVWTARPCARFPRNFSEEQGGGKEGRGLWAPPPWPRIRGELIAVWGTGEQWLTSPSPSMRMFQLLRLLYLRDLSCQEEAGASYCFSMLTPLIRAQAVQGCRRRWPKNAYQKGGWLEVLSGSGGSLVPRVSARPGRATKTPRQPGVERRVGAEFWQRPAERRFHFPHISSYQMFFNSTLST